MASLAECVILIVDDDELTRELAEILLTEYGYYVVTAGDASQALDRLSDHPEIGLIFTDLQMPGAMDGKEMLHHLRLDGCNLPAILTSGIGYIPGDLPSRTKFLSKPYKRAHLVNRIQESLAA
ncbi:response regulator [Xanthomonas citri pv. mangiferaeindicae]|uniref:response regulator n=1 Tax=Xanthomonas citri TaxID=346 RepID=UPI000CDE2D52|nr:response regulator [Xanthomonas citri]